MRGPYVIGYRYGPPHRPAGFIVTDPRGIGYVVSHQGLQCVLRRTHAPPQLHPRLVALGWTPLPPGPPHSLTGLRRLLRRLP